MGNLPSKQNEGSGLGFKLGKRTKRWSVSPFRSQGPAANLAADICDVPDKAASDDDISK